MAFGEAANFAIASIATTLDSLDSRSNSPREFLTNTPVESARHAPPSRTSSRLAEGSMTSTVVSRSVVVDDAPTMDRLAEKPATFERGRDGTTTVRAMDAGRALTSCASIARGDARADAITNSEGKTAHGVVLVISYRFGGPGAHKLSPGPETRERQITRFAWRGSRYLALTNAAVAKCVDGRIA